MSALHYDAPLAIAIVAPWFALCLFTCFNLSRLVYLIVTAETIVQRRYVVRHVWKRSEVRSMVLVDLAYPGTRGLLIPTGALVASDGRGLGIVTMAHWEPAQINALAGAVGAPVDDRRGAPTSTADLRQQWPGSIGRLTSYSGVFQLAGALLVILAFAVALAWVLVRARFH